MDFDKACYKVVTSWILYNFNYFYSGITLQFALGAFSSGRNCGSLTSFLQLTEANFVERPFYFFDVGSGKLQELSNGQTNWWLLHYSSTSQSETGQHFVLSWSMKKDEFQEIPLIESELLPIVESNNNDVDQAVQRFLKGKVKDIPAGLQYFKVWNISLFPV